MSECRHRGNIKQIETHAYDDAPVSVDEFMAAARKASSEPPTT